MWTLCGLSGDWIDETGATKFSQVGGHVLHHVGYGGWVFSQTGFWYDVRNINTGVVHQLRKPSGDLVGDNEIIPSSLRARQNGFWVVAGDPQTEIRELWLVGFDGAVTSLGVLPAKPAGVGFVSFDGRIDADGAVYQFAQAGADRFVIRRSVAGLSEIVLRSSTPRFYDFTFPFYMFTGP